MSDISIDGPARVPDPHGDRCFWCGARNCGTCLGLTKSTQMQTNDPAYWMLKDGHTSTPTVHRSGCYICEDPEFAQMGLPLCKPCSKCEGGHIAADDTECDDCGYDIEEAYERQLMRTSCRGSVLSNIRGREIMAAWVARGIVQE